MFTEIVEDFLREEKSLIHSPKLSATSFSSNLNAFICLEEQCLKTMTRRHNVQWIRCNKNMQWLNISLGQIGRKSVQNTTQYVNE